MTIEHKNISDENLHEPKGVASASADEAYLADGEGSGAWTPVALKSDIALSVGSMIVNGNTNVLAVPSSSDPTLETPSDYMMYTEGVEAGQSIGTGVTFNTNGLDVSKDGKYLLSASLSFKATTATVPNLVSFTVSTDDTSSSFIPFYAKHSVSSSGDVIQANFLKIISLTSGDSVTLWIASENAANIIVEYADITLQELIS